VISKAVPIAPMMPATSVQLPAESITPTRGKIGIHPAGGVGDSGPEPAHEEERDSASEQAAVDLAAGRWCEPAAAGVAGHLRARRRHAVGARRDQTQRAARRAEAAPLGARVLRRPAAVAHLHGDAPLRAARRRRNERRLGLVALPWHLERHVRLRAGVCDVAWPCGERNVNGDRYPMHEHRRAPTLAA
jgi:hypothetical protein